MHMNMHIHTARQAATVATALLVGCGRSDDDTAAREAALVGQGRQIFRFDTAAGGGAGHPGWPHRLARAGDGGRAAQRSVVGRKRKSMPPGNVAPVHTDGSDTAAPHDTAAAA